MELTFHIAESPLPKDILRGETVAIYTDYNEDVVEVFRSTPNSVWSNEYKCWDVRKCMISVFTRKIKELCNRKNYTSKFYIANSLKNTSTHKDINIDNFEFVTTPYEFQKEGVEFMYKHPKCFLGDEPGCLSGDTIVSLRLLNKPETRYIKLGKLFQHFHSNSDYKECRIKSLVNGRFAYIDVGDVLFQGNKETLKITLSNGNSLILTPDHEVLTSAGWVEAKNLNVNDAVVCNGTIAKCLNCGSTENIISYPYSKFKGYCKSCMYLLRDGTKYKNGEIGKSINSDGYVVLHGAKYRSYPNYINGGILEHHAVMYEHIGRPIDTSIEVVHHKDHNKRNNSIDNLELLSIPEHNAKHADLSCKHLPQNNLDYVYKNGKKIMFVPELFTIVSICEYENTDVYDIKLYGEIHNFVANGVVVHNCGKSLSNDSLLYYEDGIHTIGEAKVGDRIYGRDGKLHTIEGVYPQGELETYRVTMYDHSYVDCSLDHIWRVKTGYNGKYKDVTLKDILCLRGTFTKDFQEFYFHDSVLNPKHCIPKCKPVEYVNSNLGIEYDTVENRIEYLLKLFAYIAEDFPETVMISDDYKYLIHKSFAFTFDLKKEHEGITRINSNEIKTIINSLGGSYFTDVIKGITQDKHFIDVIVFSKEITEYVKHLCRTRDFGFSPIDYKILNITPAQETSLRNMVRNVFSKQYDSVGIESIAKLDKVPCTCIKIDAEDSLFLTNDYIVTHNTKQIIDYARYLRKNEGLKHALIICGVNGNKYNWKDEIALHSEFGCHIIGSRYSRKTGKLSSGSIADTIEDLRNVPQDLFLVMNMEKLRGAHKRRARGQRRTISEFPIAEMIQNLIDKGEIGLIAFDEIHKVKSPTSQVAQALMWLKCDRQVGASGTLVVNSPLDLYVPFSWMGLECRDYWHYQNRYAIKDHWGSVVGYQHAQEMIDVLGVYQIRRLRKNILDLPPKIQINEYVELSDKEQKFYSLIRDGIQGIVNNGELLHFDEKYAIKEEMLEGLLDESNPLTLSLRLRQVTVDTSLISNKPVPSTKLERMEEIVEDTIDNDGKCIIFSNWSQVATVVKERLAKYRPAFITGEVKEATRASEMKRFQTDVTCKVIIGTIGALGTGFSLDAANTVIFLDEPWTKAVKTQSEDRAYRATTKRSVRIITLMAKGTVDEVVHDIVENKGAMADLIVDGKVNPNKKKQLMNLLLGIDQFEQIKKKSKKRSTAQSYKREESNAMEDVF